MAVAPVVAEVVIRMIRRWRAVIAANRRGGVYLSGMLMMTHSFRSVTI